MNSGEARRVNVSLSGGGGDGGYRLWPLALRITSDEQYISAETQEIDAIT